MQRHRRSRRLVPASVAIAGVAVAVVVAVLTQTAASRSALRADVGIHKIKHVIVIMQENRSFDHYFGTFPGADGIPAGVCVPDPRNGGCRKPWVDHHDSNGNDPHDQDAFLGDVNGGKLNGFVSVADQQLCKSKGPCHPDVMGYHVGSDIPDYWAYAKNFVLQDHFFEAAGSWSLPAHLYTVSGWSAKCSDPDDPMSCKGSMNPPDRKASRPTPFAWTDLTYLLHKKHVSWGYYLDHGAVAAHHQNGVWVIWNVLPGFTDVHKDGQAKNIRPLQTFLPAGEGWDIAESVLDIAGPQGFRARPGAGQQRAGVCHQDYQRGHAQPGLGFHRDLLVLGRLGRLLRPRHAAEGGQAGLRHSRARDAHQSVRQAGIHRLPDTDD